MESFIVGTGHKYKVVPKANPIPVASEGFRDPGPEVVIEDDDDLAQAADRVQSFLDEWLYTRKWAQRQQEIVRRRHRDGEAFLLFSDNKKDGLLDVRFVEPSLIKTPPTNLAEGASFGIQTADRDVEDVLAYWIDWNGDDKPEPIEAALVQHRKANVDFTTKRGIPTLWAMLTHLGAAVEILQRMEMTARVRTAIAMIRKLKGTKDIVEQQIAAAASYQRPDPYGNADHNVKDLSPGGVVLNANLDTEYEFPGHNFDVDSFVNLVQAQLRAAAARKNLPEFLISSDASNASYSSTMVAESPAIKGFEREQADMRDDDLSVLWRMLEGAAKDEGPLAGVPLQQLEIQTEFPLVQTRDVAQHSLTIIGEKDAGIRSPQTAAAALGLDYEQEQENRIVAEKDEIEMRKAAGLPEKIDPETVDANDPEGMLRSRQQKTKQTPAKSAKK
jgi:hypothetical protein